MRIPAGWPGPKPCRTLTQLAVLAALVVPPLTGASAMTPPPTLAEVAPSPTSGVALALVLLNDVSKSIDNDEFEMIKNGYRAAFSDPDILAAVQANAGGIAITYVEFSGKDEIVTVKEWSVITDEPSTRAFGDAVAAAPRSSAGNTALAASLRQATYLLTSGNFGTARKVIDIASDHASDFGRSASARDAAVKAGITINALPIVDDHPLGTINGQLTYSANSQRPGGIANFYRREIIGGDGSFVVEARDYRAFSAALKRKLLRELLARRF
ncbi:DUF1194 domain-containing protein [Breoghania sp. L-A4]|uniref:DUF1194 domain-containing protein n=1 Tax=Breoghania sp. L-A4 TaxID=2304600 RepID=UPI0013C35D4A|nr:DUF1194 domain-containing protein [Breoghania sp. L-A4]